jgi:tripartite ATP-independent transporter DctP family solute receptor
MKKCIFWTSLCVIVFMSFGVAMAQEEYVLKFSWVDPPDPLGQSTSGYGAVLKAEIEKLSGGRIKVELYPSGQLGDQRSSTQQVRKGTVEACNISSGVLASLYYPQLGIVDLPFSFSSREVARRVFDKQNPFTKKLTEDCAEKTGIRILSLQPFGFRSLTNNVRPIKSPADMKGLKIRTMEIVPHMELMKSLEASPVPIPFLELYTSLQTKVVDGEENTLQNIIAQKFYQVQKYLTLSGHLMGVGATLINEKWFQSLPDDLKLAVIEGERVATITYTGLGELLDTLALEKLKEYGMEIYAPSPKEMKMFRDQAVPYVRKWMEEQLGADFVAEYLAAIEAAENELKAEVESLKK